MNWPAVFREATVAARRIQELVFGRRYETWVGWNLWDFALFLGPPLVVAWLARLGAEVRALVSRRAAGEAPGAPLGLEVPFGIALLLALVVLDLSGRILGEAGRIWMFLMPFAVAAVAVAMEDARDRALLPLAVGQLIVLLALRMYLNVPG
jgi:hypothetical protein